MGSVSGGCVEDDLIEKVKAQQAGAGQARGHDLRRHQRGGHPLGPALRRHAAARARAGHRDKARRSCSRSSSATSWSPGASTWTRARSRLEPGQVVRRARVRRQGAEHGARPALAAAHHRRRADSRSYLAQMAMALDYHVTVLRPARGVRRGLERRRRRARCAACPTTWSLQMNPDGHIAVVALTHDPKLDDLALLEALKSPCFYVGAIGSKQEQRRAARSASRASTCRRTRSRGCTARSA